MSKLQIPPKALFFASIVYRTDHPIDEYIHVWQNNYGPCEIFWPSFNPSFTYYSKEMGEELQRLILFCHTPQDRDLITQAKIATTNFENQNLKNGARTINIDPGVLTLENMFLTTGKPFAHRIYLGQGVYADLNYIYKQGGYQVLPWTYPDYGHPEKLAKFEEIRSKFLLGSASR